jgi:hypothetical protein
MTFVMRRVEDEGAQFELEGFVSQVLVMSVSVDLGHLLSLRNRGLSKWTVDGLTFEVAKLIRLINKRFILEI